MSPRCSPSRPHLGCAVFSARGHVGGLMASIVRSEGVRLLDWVPVSSRLYGVSLESFARVSSSRLKHRCLLIVCMHVCGNWMQPVWSWRWTLPALFSVTSNSMLLLIPSPELLLGKNKRYYRGPFAISADRTDCYHKLFLTGTDFWNNYALGPLNCSWLWHVTIVRPCGRSSRATSVCSHHALFQSCFLLNPSLICPLLKSLPYSCFRMIIAEFRCADWRFLSFGLGPKRLLVSFARGFEMCFGIVFSLVTESGLAHWQTSISKSRW